MKKQKLFFDVTQLAHWSGKITGIPRVMHELAVRFYKDDQFETVFVSWVNELQTFCVIDFEKTIMQRDNGVVYSTHAQAAPQGGETSKPATGLLKKGAIKVAKKGISGMARISPQIANKLEARAKHLQVSGYLQADIKRGDCLFIPWGEWWEPTFTGRIVAYQKQGAKLVQIIHDVATTVWPQFFEQVSVNPASYNASVVPIADLVLAVSKNTKKELTEWLKQNKLHVPRIEVFRLGDNLQVLAPRKPVDPKFKNAKLKGGDYILCVGTIEAKKNHALFYYVYKLAKARGIRLPKLAIVGRLGWHTSEIYDIMTRDPEVGDEFVFLHDTSDEELSWLYDHCLFTVLPSFHEGWGIPIAESLGRGVPCASSNTSSMVEIAEGLVEHFSPASADECLAVIQKLLKPAELKAARQRVKKYRQFSWDDSFKQVTTYLEEK